MFKKIALIASLLALAVSGCGTGPANTNGTLSVTLTKTDRTGGLYDVVATATYTSSEGKSANGIDITLNANIHTLNGTPASQGPDRLYADQSGTVSKTYHITQLTQPIYVDVTATTGGLTQSRSETIPALTSVSTTPAVVSFPNTALANAQQSVAVSGGTAPYSAALDAAHAGAFTINMNGTTITLTKTLNSGTIPIQGQLTVTDNNGNSVTIPVSYF